MSQQLNNNNQPQKKVSPIVNLFIGGMFQCIEAATLGQPFEVWKTRMASQKYRNESTLGSFANIIKERGFLGFYRGLSAKMVESVSKGAILMYAKENINHKLLQLQVSPTLAGILAGAGGGVCQVTIMGPCTYIVTAVTLHKISVMGAIKDTWAKQGFKGFYPGGVAIAFRQATNWASRQGFTEGIRDYLKIKNHGSRDKCLSKSEEILAGVIGGTLACWNHPFEVARIEGQSAGFKGEKATGMITTMKKVVANSGYKGLFRGIIPRIFLGIWQTLNMVTGAKILKDVLAKNYGMIVH